MRKKYRAEKRPAKYSQQTHTELLLVGFLLIVIIIALSIQFSSVSVENKIKQKLVGRELTYYDIRGEPRTEVINADDIKSVKLEKSETFEKCSSETCWVATIETPLPWKIYFDNNLNELGVQQLFVT